LKKLLSVPLVLLLLPAAVRAHCPLCTLGAGAMVIGAQYYGVHDAVLGVLIGAFAVATGWWASRWRWLKKERIPYQKWVIVIAAFLLTIIPIKPMFTAIAPLYISLAGGYGTLLNRTYIINWYLFGSLIGGVIVAFTPLLSKIITKLRHKALPFQGILLTLTLVGLAAGIIQWVVA